ncbi:MAG: PAS domain S-box protein, partial [Deltaproteobacteria bacterium]
TPSYRVKHADGSWRWIVCNGTPYVDTKGESRFIGVGRDVTESIKADNALRQQAEDLSARNEEMSRFNRIAIGRELRMIELKRAVNEMCGKLGEPSRYRIAEDETALPDSTEAKT